MPYINRWRPLRKVYIIRTLVEKMYFYHCSNSISNHLDHTSLLSWTFSSSPGESNPDDLTVFHPREPIRKEAGWHLVCLASLPVSVGSPQDVPRLSRLWTCLQRGALPLPVAASRTTGVRATERLVGPLHPPWGVGDPWRFPGDPHPPCPHVHTLSGLPQLLLCWKPRKVIQPFSGARTEYACSFLSFQTLIKQCIYCMERFPEKRKILLHFTWIQKGMDTSGCAWKEEVFFWFYLTFFFFFKGIPLFLFFIYFWLCWVFVSVRELSLVAVSGGHSSSRCAGLSLSRPLLLWSTGSRRASSVIVAHGPSCSAACGIFPDQGSNPCPLHWQADSQPLRHQGSPLSHF